MLFINKMADVKTIIMNAKVKSATPKVRAVTSTAKKALKVSSKP